jgi:3-isopropylmalate/(R)-2-methylmalate dehydratase small subunit
MSNMRKITRVSGRAIPLRGNDIDTDQIIPARFMKAVTFDGLGRYAFYDVRFDAEGTLRGHVMDDPRFQAKGPRIAIVNKNFGCGSSREHAPQALLRWGVKAIVGESFADIFFGNCVALGIPCVTVKEADVAELMRRTEEEPAQDLVVDLQAMKVSCGATQYDVFLPDAAQRQLVEGTWDATRTLLQAEDEIRQTAARLPYVKNFAS